MSGGQGGVWIFILGTNIVERGLKVLFFGLFPLPPPQKKRLNSAIFGLICCFSFFFRWPPPPGNFSADALGCEYQLFKTLDEVVEAKSSDCKTAALITITY